MNSIAAIILKDKDLSRHSPKLVRHDANDHRFPPSPRYHHQPKAPKTQRPHQQQPRIQNPYSSTFRT